MMEVGEIVKPGHMRHIVDLDFHTGAIRTMAERLSMKTNAASVALSCDYKVMLAKQGSEGYE